MRRTFLTLSVLVTLLLLSLGIVINLRCVGVEPLAAPDPTTPIRLADGTELPLADLLARVRDRTLRAEALAPARPAPETPPAAAPVLPPADELERVRSLEALEAEIEARHRELVETQLDKLGPVYLLAEQRRHEGDLDQALALYQSIPEDHPTWAKAQRRIGWDILTRGKGQPERGLQYLHKAVHEEPLDGNSWQDLGRAYAGTLGIDLD